MAKLNPKKPRIRKTPTMREAAEAARVKADNKKPSKVSVAANKAKKPFTKLKLPHNKATSPVFAFGRVVKKVVKFIVPNYFVNSWREVRQVTWTSRGETWRLTFAVFIFALIFGALASGVDKVLDIMFKHFILK